MIDSVPADTGIFLSPGQDEFTVDVDMGLWREKKQFDPRFDSGILLYVLAPMLQYRTGFNDAFLMHKLSALQ